MLQQCLFCPNPIDSAEHIWSDWILKDLKHATSVRMTVGRESVWRDNPKIKIKVVCRTCNNGWMSQCEEVSKLPIRAMINDNPCGLTKSDQQKLSRWAMLKAMVVDSINPARQLFYTQSERTKLKDHSMLPSRTLVWLGRLSRKAYHAGGTDVWGEIEKIPKSSHGNVTTIIVGHLFFQSLTLHVTGRFANQEVQIGCMPGDWSANLLDIWPTVGLLQWPPNVSFTFGGTNSIVNVLNRWKIGENIG
jgi:hypothetical protein